MDCFAMQKFSANDRWIVGTQSTNIPSVRLYESLAFKPLGLNMCSTSIIFNTAKSNENREL